MHYPNALPRALLRGRTHRSEHHDRRTTSLHGFTANPTAAFCDQPIERLLGLDRVTQAALYARDLPRRAARRGPASRRTGFGLKKRCWSALGSGAVALGVLACADVLDLGGLVDEINPCTVGAPDTGVISLNTPSTETMPTGIAVDGTNVYWTNSGTNTVMVCAASACDGGVPVAVSQDRPVGIACTRWSKVLDEPRPAIQDGGNIANGSGSVMQCSVPCQNPVAIATGQNAPIAIAVANTGVYWVNQGTTDATGAPNDDPAP